MGEELLRSRRDAQLCCQPSLGAFLGSVGFAFVRRTQPGCSSVGAGDFTLSVPSWALLPGWSCAWQTGTAQEGHQKHVPASSVALPTAPVSPQPCCSGAGWGLGGAGVPLGSLWEQPQLCLFSCWAQSQAFVSDGQQSLYQPNFVLSSGPGIAHELFVKFLTLIVILNYSSNHFNSWLLGQIPFSRICFRACSWQGTQGQQPRKENANRDVKHGETTA